MRPRLSNAPFMVILLLFSCKRDNTTEPPIPTAEPFSISITVRSTGGQPVPGLRISAWNNIPFFNTPMIHAGSPEALPVTTGSFRVGIRARVNFSVYQMDGSFYATVVDDTLDDGNYMASFSVADRVPTRVLKCRFVGRTVSSDSLLFTDSIYAVLHQPDASISILGWTDPAGVFQSTDSLLFPNVLGLPPMVRTESGGPQPVGTFNIPDSITIVLADTASQQSQTFAWVVRRGTNNIQLTWNPGPLLNGPERQPFVQPSERTATRRNLTRGTVQWELYQNFPNPFN